MAPDTSEPARAEPAPQATAIATTTPAARPATSSERAIVPDLARGAMLLFIAVANAPWYLYGAAQDHALWAHPSEGSMADRLAQVVSIVAIDGRSYPMFAFLFGYGIWQLYSRQMSRGIDPRAARRVLQRRGEGQQRSCRSWD